MLAIRMQRLGRKGHPTYRVVVQDSRQTPSSHKVVATIGSYDPHSKTTTLVKEKAEFYLSNGAQPSERVVELFKSEKVKLPDWVKTEKTKKTRTTRNPDKLRKNRPAEEATTEAETSETPADESKEEVSESASDEKPSETKDEAKSEEPAEKEAEASEEVKKDEKSEDK